MKYTVTLTWTARWETTETVEIPAGATQEEIDAILDGVSDDADCGDPDDVDLDSVEFDGPKPTPAPTKPKIPAASDVVVIDGVGWVYDGYCLIRAGEPVDWAGFAAKRWELPPPGMPIPTVTPRNSSVWVPHRCASVLVLGAARPVNISTGGHGVVVERGGETVAVVMALVSGNTDGIEVNP